MPQHDANLFPSLQSSEADAAAALDVPTFEVAANQGIGLDEDGRVGPGEEIDTAAELAPRIVKLVLDANLRATGKGRLVVALELMPEAAGEERLDDHGAPVRAVANPTAQSPADALSIAEADNSVEQRDVVGVGVDPGNRSLWIDEEAAPQIEAITGVITDAEGVDVRARLATLEGSSCSRHSSGPP